LIPNTTRHVPVKALTALTALVTLLHAMILQGAPMTLGLSQVQLPKAFITRTIESVPLVNAPAEQSLPLPTPVQTKTKPTTAALNKNPPAAVEPVKEPAASNTSTNIEPADKATVEDQAVFTVAKEEKTTPQLEAPPETERSASQQPLAGEGGSAVRSYSVPGSVRIKYEVEANRFPYSFSSELIWQQDGESYEARSEWTKGIPLRTQTSRGLISPDGLVPKRFTDKTRSEIAVHFDRENGKIIFSNNRPEMKLLAGAQDRLSLLIQLAALISANTAQFTTGGTVTLQVVGPRDADAWTFTVAETETLKLPGGEQATLKLIRNPRREFDQKLEVWLAPALGHLPARIRITDTNGEVIDQKWLATEPQV